MIPFIAYLAVKYSAIGVHHVHQTGVVQDMAGKIKKKIDDKSNRNHEHENLSLEERRIALEVQKLELKALRLQLDTSKSSPKN